MEDIAMWKRATRFQMDSVHDLAFHDHLKQKSKIASYFSWVAIVWTNINQIY